MDDRAGQSAPQRQPRDARGGAPDAGPAGAGVGSATRPALSSQQEGFAAAHGAEQNRLLHALPAEEYARLLPQLTAVRLGFKQVLVEPDVPIRDVHFPHEGVASIVADDQEGGVVEVGTIGPDGFAGIPVVHAAESMPYRVFVQIEGHAWRLSADTFRRLVEERPAVRTSSCATRSASPTRPRSRSPATGCTRTTGGARGGCS